MTKSELLLRSILGPVRADVRPLAYAVDIAGELLFVRRIPMDDIRVTKDGLPPGGASGESLLGYPGGAEPGIGLHRRVDQRHQSA